jgi:hypothetical protein
MQSEFWGYLVGAVLMLIWQIVATPWAEKLPPTSRGAIVFRFLHCGWKAIEAVRAAQKEAPALNEVEPKTINPDKVKRSLIGLLVVLTCVGCVRSGKNPCTAYSEREYWFGGGAKLSGGLALAASGTAIPVQGERERTALAIGAATTGAMSLAMMWLADSASESYDAQCRVREPVK